MTTPQAQYIEQPESEDFFDHLEKVTCDLESERISHGLTRGILFCHIDMIGALAKLQSEFAQVVAESNPPAAAPAPAQEVGLTEAERVRCLIASGCIGTVKMTYDSGPYEITRTSINASRLIDAIIADLRAKEGK